MRKTSVVRLAIPIAIGALVLSGCGGGGDSGTTYKIAYQGPLSGSNPALGENMQQGIQLAIEEANESGDYDFEIEYLAADDEGEEGAAPAAAQIAIGDPDVMAVIGPAFSGPSNASLPLYGEAGLAAVTTSATLPALTEDEEHSSFLRAVPDDNAQGPAMAQFLAAQDGVENVMVIDDVTAYGEGLAEVVVSSLEEEGLTVQRESVPQSEQDYSGAARTVVRSGVDALVYAGYYQDLGPFASQLADAGFDGIGVSGDGSNDDEFINLAGDASEGWYLTCPCTSATDDEATTEFAERYEEAYGEAPGTYSAESYDVANMIIETIASLQDDVNRESVLEALTGAQFEGLTKTFSFDENGELAEQVIYLYQVDGGQRGYLGPVEELVGG
ncbi:branched-chain amino acid ABC transporter substrate-binding protein [Streptomyces sp. DSM 44917]|uniref:Branched-chain amino acid ABC transporter substrate-binding protein n=1 Tax=Streptomyces boetiae TaxID=3075541 RepID=A0ABU2L587_9ACTN|nr:branched-chain amino acid ABC transporter substrate-binding protein [Streptomyces sp. DSM 44917]MDT0306672.1 branched-chain amino acid ABC transporter substrate-binding protein [Streptomyces sp. DSM 44917]